MRILVETGCTGGPCPTVYEGEDGSLYVQGYIPTPAERAQISLPVGEDLVRINRELLNAIQAIKE